MAKGHILVGTTGYVLAPFERNGRTALIHRDTIDPSVPRFSTTGGRLRPEEMSSVDRYIFPNLTKGFGRDRIDSDSAFKSDEYRRFFDSTCETRFHEIRLAILNENSTHTGLEVIRASTTFKGDLWALWTDDADDDLVARKYTGSSTTWEGGGGIVNIGGGGSSFVAGLDIIAQKTHLIVLQAQTNDHGTMRSTDGASWAGSTATPTANLLAHNVTQDEDVDAGLLADIGSEAVAVLWHEANGTITFFSSTNAGDNWTDEAVDISSGNGPQGVAVMAGIDNEDKLYVGTREGLWEVDTAPSTWTTRLLFPMPASTDNCRRMTVHNGSLYFGEGVDNNSPAPAHRLTNQQGVHVFESDLGLDRGDGVTTDLLGPFRWWVSAGKFLFASVGGGAADRKARIVCWTGEGWHHIFQNGTANQKIDWLAFSPDDDGKPRLHFAMRTASATSDAEFLAYPLTNPRSLPAGTIKTQASGLIDLPYIDAGLPLEDKGWLRTGINAVDLSGDNSGEYINVDYGLDDGSGGLQARSASDLGDFLSTVSTKTFGSGAGVSSRNLGQRINLIRDASNTTHTPRLKDVEVAVQPHVVTKDRFTVLVDIQATANQSSELTPEAVIANLQTSRALVTLPAFQYGNLTSTFVKIKPPTLWFEDLVNPGGGVAIAPDVQAQRTGYVLLTLEEVIS